MTGKPTRNVGHWGAPWEVGRDGCRRVTSITVVAVGCVLTKGAHVATRFVCPACGAWIAAPDGSAGRRGKCSRCKSQIRVPLPEGRDLAQRSEPGDRVSRRGPAGAMESVPPRPGTWTGSSSVFSSSEVKPEDVVPPPPPPLAPPPPRSAGKTQGVSKSKKRAGVALGGGVVSLILVGSLVFAWNYFLLQAPMSSVLSADRRNGGIEVSAHYLWYLKPSVLVYDLRAVPMDKSPADVFRVFLQFAEKVEARHFDEVYLCHRGKLKFKIAGDYFHTLGAEYSSQNPVYTMRTFPENLMTPEGGRAYSGWSGGWLGVLAKQMEDFKDFHEKWYVRDM